MYIFSLHLKVAVLWVILLFLISWSRKLWTGEVVETLHISRLKINKFIPIKIKSHRIMGRVLNLHFLYFSNVDTEISLANEIKDRIYICFVNCWRYASHCIPYNIQHNDTLVLVNSYFTKQIISIVSISSGQHILAHITKT